MKQESKITKGYQWGKTILDHICAVVLIFLVLATIFAWSLSKTPLQEIVSTVFTIVYGLAMYSSSHKFAEIDNKTYTPLTPDVKKAWIWGITIVVLNFIIYALYHIAWNIDALQQGNGLIVRIIVNMIFSIWTFPYVGLIGASKGYVMWYSFIIWTVVPIASTVLGYIAGCKKFYISERLNNIMYKKEK